MANLTPRQDRFCEEYLVDLNGTAAATRAGFAEKSAKQEACRLLGKPHIQARISTLKAERSLRVAITADQIVERLLNVVEADPGELIEFRRTCCRHCWGEGHRHQYTAHEMATRREAFDKKSRLGEDEAAPWDADGMFDEGGGIGYDARREANPDCPECFGEGVGQAFVHDTRKLSVRAKALFAGVKVTKDGVEIKMQDRGRALELLGNHIGMFRNKHEISGPDGGAMQVDDGEAAARVAALMAAAAGRKAAGQTPPADDEG